MEEIMRKANENTLKMQKIESMKKPITEREKKEKLIQRYIEQQKRHAKERKILQEANKKLHKKFTFYGLFKN